jgi:putative SOS response-associated peptidase YedK
MAGTSLGGSSWVCSFAIITTTPNDLCAELHNRMPVVLNPEPGRFGSGRSPFDASELKALLAPFPLEEMTCWPESTRVGNVKKNDPTDCCVGRVLGSGRAGPGECP